MSIFSDMAKMTEQEGDETSLAPIDDISQQRPDETKLVAYVKEKIEQVRQSNSRITLEQIYLTNVAYLLGFDGVVWDANYRQFRNTDPKRKLSRNRFKINKILPTVQNRLARLTQSPPKYDVRPNSNDSEDKDACRLGLQIIENVFDKQDFTEKKQDVLMSAMQGGVSYVQVLWDDTLGKPMVDPEGEKLVGYEGDIRLEVLNCLEVFPDPLAKTLDDCSFVIKAKVRKLDYFKEHYPDRGKAVKEEGAWLLASLFDMKANSLTSVGIAGAQTNDQQKNSAIEIIYYEKRSTDHPNGRKVVCASGVLLKDDELPIGEYDLVKFDDILVGGRYNSEAIITHLRPIQDQYNITRTKCADWIRKTLGGKFLVPKGSGLSQEALNNDSGEVIEYNPVPGAQPPTAMVIPAIPQYVYEDIGVLNSEFDFVSGINEPTRGAADPGQNTLGGMRLQVEQDQTRMGVQTNRNEIAYAKLGQKILKYVGKMYTMPRILKEAGDGLGYAVKDFVGADLRDNYDVIVVPGSTVPKSKTINRQDIMNAFQMGLLGDPADPQLRAKVLSMMEYGDIAEVWKEQALNEQQVKKMIESVEQNSVDIANPGHEWDDHPFFVRKMNEYRKQDKFDKLSPDQKAVFNYIAEWHVQAEVQRQFPEIPQKQMMAQQMVNTTEQMKQQGPPPMPQQEEPGGEPGPSMPMGA